VLGTVPLMERKPNSQGILDRETLDTRSSISEAFRTIRTALTFSDAGKGTRSLVITSTVKQEGKSLVAINLAVSMARSGKRVLLIDAEMRRGRLHKAFELDNEEGFSSVLLGTRTLSEVEIPTQIENLTVIPRGLIPPDPVELLQNGLTPQLFEEVFEEFDLVIFDSPPTGVVSDACVLATVVDRTIFVVRSLSADRGLCRRAVQQLRSVNTRFAGVILNFADSKADRYGSYGYDYNYLPTEEAQGSGGHGD
jgi:capsular exopolysaccharide synthesis family protein